MLPIELRRLGAAYYTGNCHKWLCTPKGSAFLHVRRDRQAAIRPLAISHGANSTRTDRSRFRLEFDFCGTCDASPWLAIPAALAFLGRLLPGGIPALMAHNRALALRARDLLCSALGSAPPCPDSMIGSLASIVLDPLALDPVGPLGLDPLQVRLWERWHVEVPVMRWASPRLRMLRVSPQAYNSVEQYEYLARAVVASERELRGL
jgi:isopenicillin-N epimerase